MNNNTSREALIAELKSACIDGTLSATLVTKAIDVLEADAQRITELEALSVTNIMIDVVPGDGSGFEVFAKSTSDVEELLTKMSEKIEDFESSKWAQQVSVPTWKAEQIDEFEIRVVSPEGEAWRLRSVDKNDIFNNFIWRWAQSMIKTRGVI